MDFGSILGGFLEHFGSQNAFKNRVKFWRRFFHEKPSRAYLKRGRPGGMRGGPGEDYGGVRVQIPAENSGRDRRQGPGALESDLARRPRWGGGSLRAFRRAVLFGLFAW